jgi:hypothetical protein
MGGINGYDGMVIMDGWKVTDVMEWVYGMCRWMGWDVWMEWMDGCEGWTGCMG